MYQFIWPEFNLSVPNEEEYIHLKCREMEVNIKLNSQDWISPKTWIYNGVPATGCGVLLYIAYYCRSLHSHKLDKLKIFALTVSLCIIQKRK